MTLLTTFKKHWIFFAVLIIFLALLARNPFSTRTLIPNLEPYPDTIHYLSPPHNLVAGHGFSLWREGRSLKSWVPPLYSALMIPAFLIHNDVRMFYFVNVLLAIISFLFFYLIIRKITSNVILLGVALFLYATNYFNYWYPTLAMGENLVIPLFLVAVWLLTLKTSLKNMVLFGLLSVAVYATKSANLPITAGLVLGYCLKLFMETKEKIRFREVLKFIGIFAAFFLVFSIYYQLQYGSSILSSLFFFLGNLFPGQKAASVAAQSSGSWFSFQFMKENLPKYARTMLGGYSVRFLWDNTPIVPIYVGTTGLAGLMVAVADKKYRIYGITLFIILAASVLFMSTFYSTDMRYLYQAIPILLIGFVFLFNGMLQMKRLGFLIPVVLFLIFGFYSATNAIRLKKQVMLNLKYSETPWYYLSVLELNKYFSTHPSQNKKPIVISAMIPYYIDFYSNGAYSLLPLSRNQEFPNQRDYAWGKHDYTNLPKLYDSYLKQGYNIYIQNYGIGNEKPLQDDFRRIIDTYKTTLVSEGCYGACSIWKIEFNSP